VIEEVKRYAHVAKISKDLTRATIGLIGPRQTWRVAGPQDMTVEEWDLSQKLGATIVHLEMEELLKLAESQKTGDAVGVVNSMREKRRLGEAKIEEDRLIYAGRIYLGIRQLMKRYGLTAMTAECYPQYSGLANLPSSWLADEGIILDTEGDIGHTLFATAMQWMSGSPVALAEVGSLDSKRNCLCWRMKEALHTVSR
jgi:L-fucose isomerase-like protein